MVHIELKERNGDLVIIKADGDSAPRIDVAVVAKLMHMNHNTIRKGLQDGVFPWGLRNQDF